MRLTHRQQEHCIYGIVFAVLLVGCILLITGSVQAPQWKFTNNTVSDTPEVPVFNKQQLSLDDPNSLWIIVNKQRSMPANFTPNDLRQPDVTVRSPGSNEMLLRDSTASAVEAMVAAAAKEGINLMLVSGFRSYGLQQSVYNGNVAGEGRTNADKTSARPGHSEHQTGLAADIGATSRACELEACFGQTAEGQWLAAHGHTYGFVVRYPNGLEGVTGYTYEPWHMRFVGAELAAEIHKSGQTLEQFFDLPAAPDY